MKKVIYIHYGTNNINKDLIRPGKNPDNKKPEGFWACRQNCQFGWREWCIMESFQCDTSKSVRFTLSDNSKILEIHYEDDIIPYLIRDYNEYSVYFRDCFNSQTSIFDEIDIDKLLSEGYDGIELFFDNISHFSCFNSWDVSSIVIWNPNIIEEVGR